MNNNKNKRTPIFKTYFLCRFILHANYLKVFILDCKFSFNSSLDLTTKTGSAFTTRNSSFPSTFK
jgi:hypothetical protein